MKSHRPYLAAFALALLVMLVLLVFVPSPAAARPAGALRVSQPADSAVAPPPWQILNPSLCIGDTLRLRVMGYEPTPCDTFLGVEVVSPRHVVVSEGHRTLRLCAVGPSKFYPVDLALGSFGAAGPGTVAVDLQSFGLDSLGPGTPVTTRYSLPYTVRAVCDTTPPPPPYVNQVVNSPSIPCESRPMVLAVGYFLPACVTLTDSRVLGADRVSMTFDSRGDTAAACQGMPVEGAVRYFTLGPYSPGPHTVFLDEDVLHDGTVSHYTYAHAFTVAAACDSAGGIPGSRYITSVSTDPAVPCAGSPVSLVFDGQFPDACGRYVGANWLPGGLLSIVLDRGYPSDTVAECAAVVTPWHAVVPLGTLRSGRLIQPVAEVIRNVPGVPGGTLQTSFNWYFSVAATCDTVPPPPVGVAATLDTLRTVPGNPCATLPAALHVSGSMSVSCGRVTSAQAVGEDQFLVTLDLRPLVSTLCPPVASRWSADVPLGILPAGRHVMVVDLDVVAASGTTRLWAADTLVVAALCDTSRAAPGSLYITGIQTRPAVPCAGAPTVLELAGQFPNGCGQLVSASLTPTGVLDLELDAGARTDSTDTTVACRPGPAPWDAAVVLGMLPAGRHIQKFRETILHEPSAGGNTLELGFQDTIGVAARCDTVISPQPSPVLPNVDAVTIGSAEACWPQNGLVCAGDSIRVTFRGSFTDCRVFKRFEIVPGPASVQAPPTVRAVIGLPVCPPQPCPGLDLDAVVPWSANVMLPPMPARQLVLPLEVEEEFCQPGPADTIFHASQAFVVTDSCMTGATCLTGDWLHPAAGQCDASIQAGGTAAVVFTVRPDVPLAGLQGDLVLSPPGLAISTLETTGDATGMHLVWTATQAGARFVLYAERGADLPRTLEGSQVLRVTLAAIAGRPTPALTLLTAANLLGSDVSGGAVRECVTPPCLARPGVVRAARICGDLSCDFNGDGTADVRDLVQMVHCVNGEGPCPDSAAARFDCDGDHVFDLADVLCCANSLLIQQGCPGCVPDSASAHHEPRVAVTLGGLARTSLGADLVLHVAGAQLLGALRLDLAFPADRYRVGGVALPADAADWLPLHQVQGARLSIGLIDTHTGPSARSTPPPASLDVTVHLALLPDQDQGGTVSLASGDFSGSDGSKLLVDLGAPFVTLAGPLRISVGQNRPNPFRGRTSINLSLDQAADVDVSIFDLAGRRVATLQHGRLGSGTTTFRWYGLRDDRTPVPNGVYFYRVTSPEGQISRKMMFFGGPYPIADAE